MNKFIILSLLVSFQILAVAQKPVQNLSLEEAIALASVHNVNLKNNQLDQNYAEAQVREIRAQGLPQVNGNFGFTHNLKIATQVLPDFISPSVYGVLFQEGVIAPKSFEIATFPAQFGVPYTMNAGVGLNQLLFDGTFFLGLKAASEFVNVSKINQSLEEITVRESVTKSYYAAVITATNIEQMRESLSNLQKMKSETEALYKAGFAEKLDVDRLVLSVSNLEVSINQLENQAKLAKQMLLFNIGIDVNTEISLSTALSEKGDVAALLSSSTEQANRMEYKLLAQQSRLDSLNIKRWKVGYLPSLYGNFNYGGNTFAGKNQFSDLGKKWFPISSYGVSLNVPIFDGLYKKAKIDQAKISAEKTNNNLAQLDLGINLEIAQAKTTLLNALKNLELQEKSKELANQVYETTSKKFKAGVGSSFELISAETERTKAITNYLNALYELNIAKINLQKANGQF